MLQNLRSLLFIAQMYAMMAVMAVLYLPWMAISPYGALAACHAYARWVQWSAGWMVGLKCEIRGTPPSNQLLVAAKHQSFLDIIMIFGALSHGKFIMKRELLYAPILGQYAYRLGCVPVDRGKRGQAVSKMLNDVERGTALPGQLVIYPQGTRVAPGVEKPYKVGTAILYSQMGTECVPVATNCGVFWPKRGLRRKPGTAVVEFLPAIPAGLDKDSFLTRLEHEVETASNRLLDEAGFKRP